MAKCYNFGYEVVIKIEATKMDDKNTPNPSQNEIILCTEKYLKKLGEKLNQSSQYVRLA